jgi:hypothetical protein
VAACKNRGMAKKKRTYGERMWIHHQVGRLIRDHGIDEVSEALEAHRARLKKKAHARSAKKGTRKP